MYIKRYGIRRERIFPFPCGLLYAVGLIAFVLGEQIAVQGDLGIGHAE